eukprot:g2685.t1
MMMNMPKSIVFFSIVILLLDVNYISAKSCEDLSEWTFEVFDGSGNGSLVKNATGDGCDGVIMSTEDSMAASFRSRRSPIRPGSVQNATFKLKTFGLVPTHGDGAAYLTGGVYMHFYDVNNESAAWNPQFGELAPSSTHDRWDLRRTSFNVPTTAAYVEIHLAFAAHTFTYSPNRMNGGRAMGQAALASFSLEDVGNAAQLGPTIEVPDDPTLQGAIDQAFRCLHNSQQSGNFTVGAGYTISGNISPDLTFGLYGIRRTAHDAYLDQIRKQWEWHSPDPTSGEYVAGRVMGQVNWPLGVDAIFSYSGDENYLRSHLPIVDASLAFVNSHADHDGLVSLVPVGHGRMGGGDYHDEGEWMDDTVWSIYHGVANETMKENLFRRIDSNASFYEGIPIRWSAFPTAHGACSWFGRLGAGDIMARAHNGQEARSYELLTKISETVVSQHDIYEGYDMQGCGKKSCGCTTSGFGDYFEHCGGLVWSVVEGVFGLDFDSTPSYVATLEPHFPSTWKNASMRTRLRGRNLSLSLLEDTVRVSLDASGDRGDDEGLSIRVVGCTPSGVAYIPVGGSVALNCRGG